jgi:endonuclease YncB( thermonuclease family)
MHLQRIRTLTAALVATAALLVPAALSGAAPAEAGGARYGKVTFVDDGDTVDVDIAGDGTSQPARVRYIGVQAMELHRYSHSLSKIRGECWGVDATRYLYSLTNRKRVMLTARHDSSRAGNGRLRRSVAVLQNGVWTDTGALLISAGLALPDLLGDEYAPNLDYLGRAQEAAANHVGMWGNPVKCGYGPAQDAVLSVNINWDAAGNDARNVNGEWIDITNHGAAPVSLAGWWIRDAAYRGVKAHGYVFPAGTVIAPGSHLRLRMGRGGRTATTQHWGLRSPVFANATGAPQWMGDGAWLFDPQGDLRFWQMYPCRFGC